ncbi:MAG: hypothetical protein ACXWET_03730 [Halobacteriota archaeon]
MKGNHDINGKQYTLNATPHRFYVPNVAFVALFHFSKIELKYSTVDIALIDVDISIGCPLRVYILLVVR